jgi:hypothetical protein
MSTDAMTRERALFVITGALDRWERMPMNAGKTRDAILNEHRGLKVWLEPYALHFDDWAIVCQDRRTLQGAAVSYHEALEGKLS